MAGGVVAFGQTNSTTLTNEPADDWKPATSNQQGRQYPQVNSESRVRERVIASGAQNVQLDLGWRKISFGQG